MTEILGTATFEEFLDSFRALWGLRVLVSLLLLAAVVRMVKSGRVATARVLVVGLGCLVMGGLLECASRYGLVELGYSPSYASMRAEWDMGPPDWESWEPMFWWTRYGLSVLGMLVAGVGFVMLARTVVMQSLQRDLNGVNTQPEVGHGN